MPHRLEVAVDVAGETGAADEEVEDGFRLHNASVNHGFARYSKLTHDEKRVADARMARVGKPSLEHADHDHDECGSEVAEAPAL